MESLNEQLWAVAKEYARLFGEIIQMEPEHWVGDCPDMCCFGDCYFFTLEEIRQVVDDITKYTKRYGSAEAVGQEIRDWVDWWLESPSENRGELWQLERVMPRVTGQLRVNINLKSWLDGCPREDRQPWSGPDADYLRLMNDSDTVERLIKEYGGCQELNDVMEGITFELDKATKAKAKRDIEQWEDYLKNREL